MKSGIYPLSFILCYQKLVTLNKIQPYGKEHFHISPATR